MVDIYEVVILIIAEDGTVVVDDDIVGIDVEFNKYFDCRNGLCVGDCWIIVGDSITGLVKGAGDTIR